MRTPTIDPSLVSVLKKLTLGHLVDTLGERLVLADKQSMSTQDLLLLVLSDEVARRESTSAQRRANAAGLDPAMQIERWDKTAKVTYDKRVFAELMSLRFIESHQHIIVLGPVGVGKTFLASALGHIACRHRYQVLFIRADEMLRALAHPMPRGPGARPSGRAAEAGLRLRNARHALTSTTRAAADGLASERQPRPVRHRAIQYPPSGVVITLVTNSIGCDSLGHRR